MGRAGWVCRWLVLLLRWPVRLRLCWRPECPWWVLLLRWLWRWLVLLLLRWLV